MARTLPHHHELNASGCGKCSVPMWSGGVPAGFCDAEAYGRQTKQYLASFPEWNRAYSSPAYAPGLACPAHGGPSKPEKREGLKLVATVPEGYGPWILFRGRIVCVHASKHPLEWNGEKWIELNGAFAVQDGE